MKPKRIRIKVMKGIDKTFCYGVEKYIASIKIKGVKYEQTCLTLIDAIDYRNQIKNGDVLTPEAQPQKKTTLHDVWLYMNKVHFSTLANSTKNVMSRRYAGLKELHHVPLTEMTSSKINEWLAERVTYFKSNDYQSQVIGYDRRCNMNNEINLISTLWNWCLLQDTYREELAGLKNPIIKRQHKKQGEVKLVPYRHRDFSIEELLLTMEHCKEPYNQLLEFLYLTGCRIGEAGGLKWGDINFKKKTVMIERSAEYDNNKKFIALTPWPKNRTRKIIHLSEAIEIILNDLKALKINDCDFVFQLNGRPLNYGTLLSSIRRSQAKAGVLARGTHVCRIGGSKTVRRDFGNIDSVISYTGHKDPKMADHYSKLDSDDSKKVYSRVSDLILNAKLKNNQANGRLNVIRLGEHR